MSSDSLLPPRVLAVASHVSPFIILMKSFEDFIMVLCPLTVSFP